jgi:hypothetical protein
MAEIEMLTLANHAEAVNGLLYLSGAGWDRVTRRYPRGQKPLPNHFGIAVSVLIPWTEANRKHHLSLWIESEDGGQSLIRADGELEVGRPPGVPEGSDRRAVLAIDAQVVFPAAGGYRLVGQIGEGRRTYGFSVVDETVA